MAQRFVPAMVTAIALALAAPASAPAIAVGIVDISAGNLTQIDQ
jgi:hypothetical protein